MVCCVVVGILSPLENIHANLHTRPKMTDAKKTTNTRIRSCGGPMKLIANEADKTTKTNETKRKAQRENVLAETKKRRKRIGFKLSMFYI